MYHVTVDGKKIGDYKRAAYAKKQADVYLDIGGFAATVWNGKQIYAMRHFDTEWRRGLGG